MHVCPLVTPGTPPVPHVGGAVIKGAPTILVAGMPQARAGDQCTCTGPPDVIAKGSPTVLMGGMPAARIGDQTAHGGVITSGAPNVLIGISGAGGAATSSQVVRGTLGPAGQAGEGPDAIDRPEEVVSDLFQSRAPQTPPVICAPEEHPFEKRFQEITGGLTMDQAIAMYERDAGNTIDKDTIQTLFEEPAKATVLLSGNRKLDKEFRDILNTNTPPQEPEGPVTRDGEEVFVAEDGSEWRLMPSDKAVFHNPLHDPDRNSKFVARDGHREAVYGPDGAPISGSVYRGTFNFVGPDEALGHTGADVAPWGHHEGGDYLAQSGRDAASDAAETMSGAADKVGSFLKRFWK
jgi:uncharacterized Zn-binding protein involved in type VI secretion